jgi:hypothetical protein
VVPATNQNKIKRMIKPQPTGPPQVTASRLNQYTLLAAAAAAAVAGTQQADGAVVYSGVVNIPIPDTTAGVYLDVDTGANATAPFAGWDLNPYSAGRQFFTTGAGAGVAATGGVLTNFAPGATIDSSLAYGKENFTTGADMANFPAGSTGIVGFHTDGNLFGWMRFTSAAAGSPGTIVDYALENVAGTSILAGANGVPEPGSMGLLALGAAGLATWRRRKAA